MSEAEAHQRKAAAPAAAVAPEAAPAASCSEGGGVDVGACVSCCLNKCSRFFGCVWCSRATAILTLGLLFWCVNGRNITFAAVGSDATVGHRIGFALNWLSVSVIVPFAAIMYAERQKDCQSCTGDDVARQRNLQFVLAKFVLHTVNVLSLAVNSDHTTVKFIPMLCLLFLLGRVFVRFCRRPFCQTFGRTISKVAGVTTALANLYLAYQAGVFSATCHGSDDYY